METISRLVATALINSLWQVTLVGAIAALCARLLKSAPARHRHALWVMALALSLALPIASLRHAIGLRQSGAAPIGDAASAAGVQVSPAQQATPMGAVWTASKRTVSAGWTREGVVMAVRRLRNVLAGHTPAVPWSPLLGYTALAVYLVSLLFHATGLVRAWMKTREIKASARALEIPQWMASVTARCRREFGAPSRPSDVALLFSSRVAGPLTLGARHPAIILPEGLLNLESGASREELASALCHEMAHIGRRDFLMNLVYELLLLPLAFHPAARIIKRRIDETRELACDEMAAGRVVSPTTYARSLVSLAASVSRLASPPPLAGPGYTLGVFDANILEERIMRLLDQRPRLSARRAMLLLAGAALTLTASALAANTFSLRVRETAPQATTTVGASDARPDYSGRWELDKAKSDLPDPSPDNLVEVIELRDSSIRISTTSKDWNIQKPIAVTIFALTIPEFNSTTDNMETTQSYGPGALKSKTRWEGASLITEWQLDRDGQTVMTGTWRRSLAADGKTQTVEVKAEDPAQGRHGSARLVFVKRASEGSMAQFLGRWTARFQGKPFTTLILKSEGAGLSGTLSPFTMELDANGSLTVATPLDHGGGWHVIHAKLDGAAEPRLTLTCKEDDDESIDNFEMRVTGSGEAEFRPVGQPIEVKPWKMTRESADNRLSLGATSVLQRAAP